MAKSKGFRKGTRALLSERPREHGKLGLSRLLHEYKPGDKAVIIIDPSIHKGMPHHRYQGKVGTITAKRGKAFEVNVTQGESMKKIIVRPEHLKPHTGG